MKRSLVDSAAQILWNMKKYYEVDMKVPRFPNALWLWLADGSTRCLACDKLSIPHQRKRLLGFSISSFVSHSFTACLLAGKFFNMPPTATQRHVISQFMSITGAQERVAQTVGTSLPYWSLLRNIAGSQLTRAYLQFCKKYSWKLDQACDA